MTCAYIYPAILGPGELCGVEADPKSKQVTGEWLCEFHLEEWLRREM